jgi:hypothetical protein
LHEEPPVSSWDTELSVIPAKSRYSFPSRDAYTDVLDLVRSKPNEEDALELLASACPTPRAILSTRALYNRWRAIRIIILFNLFIVLVYVAAAIYGDFLPFTDQIHKAVFGISDAVHKLIGAEVPNLFVIATLALIVYFTNVEVSRNLRMEGLKLHLLMGLVMSMERSYIDMLSRHPFESYFLIDYETSPLRRTISLGTYAFRPDGRFITWPLRRRILNLTRPILDTGTLKGEEQGRWRGAPSYRSIKKDALRGVRTP